MKIGIIGGSGLDNPNLLEDYEEKEIETKYGFPSSKITCGKISGVDVCILARHGKKHEIPPSQVNYRANIAALKMLGCEIILASSAAGSLKEEINPGDLVFPDQIIDFTKQRKSSFYDKEEVFHLPFSEPFSEKLRKLLINTAQELGFRHHPTATLIVIEGPRFSTRAESLYFKQLGDIIGMTAMPEACLAKEAGIEYATIAMSTDYDCWRENTEPVTFEIIKKRMEENSEKVKKIFVEAIKKLGEDKLIREDEDFIKNIIRTIPNFPKAGIMFRDITTLLKNAEGFQKILELLEKRYKNINIDVIAGIESRGFVLASALASKLGKGLVLVRKPGKLPGEKVREEYDLEYGKDAVEIHKDAISPGQKVLIIDDLLATGGTMKATCNLIEKLGGEIVECAFVVELEDLGGRKKLEEKGHNVFSLVKFKETEA
ncbi:S-methyl-5'-thioadenosine phosphorylase [Candidatus Pacearchaeota archaeon]|nr:S-methyl-5'-thioadenosine phosphorylase [Candidatus Pacearchaeota archaeon]